MLKRNLVLAILISTLYLLHVVKKPKKLQLTVNLKPQQAPAVRIIKDATASAASATANAGDAVASAATTGAVSRRSNQRQLKLLPRTAYTANVATGAANVAQGAEAVKNDAANSKTDIKQPLPKTKILNLVFSLKTPNDFGAFYWVNYFG